MEWHGALGTTSPEAKMAVVRVVAHDEFVTMGSWLVVLSSSRSQ